MRFLGLFLAIVLLLIAVPAQTVTERSYRQAREVLDRAVAAYGGIDKLRAVQTFSLKAVGETVQRNQSRRPFMAERTPYTFDLIVDLKGNRFIQTADGGYPGGFHYINEFAVAGTEGVGIDRIRKTFRPQSNVPAAAIRGRQRFLTQFVVLNALERASRLRYLGKTEYERRAHDVISYSNEDGVEVSLYIDSSTGLLSKFESMGTDPFAGDATFENIFNGYKKDGDFQLPTGRELRVAGELTEQLRYESLSINSAIDEARFKVPDGFAAAATNVPPPLTKLSENAYTINAGGYNVLFVAFNDHIFVMEAPGGDAVSKQAIEQVKKTFPGKPIRYIAVTHHHDDHAGGIRTYVAEGATLIGVPDEKEFFQKVMASKFTINPDALALNPKPFNFEPVTGEKKVLTDGRQIVEIYNIGSGPHTDAMLVAYLPNEKVIFQGDLVNRPLNGDYPIANDTTVHFAKWLDSKKLPVERIVAVHGTPTTMDELRKAVADKESAVR